MALLLGFIAAWLYERSGPIIPAIALHAAWSTATTLTLAGIYTAWSASARCHISPMWMATPFGHRDQT